VAPLGTSPFRDARPSFFQRLEALFADGDDGPVRLLLPFAQLTKSEVIRRGTNLPLEQTLSCLRPVRELHCGTCNKCAERQRAFAEAGFDDPTRYANVSMRC
jgi:7-cyano-7-deazaguanine synthase